MRWPWIAIGAPVVIVAALIAAGGKSRDPTAVDYLNAAKFACKEFIVGALHDPDSAQFPPYDEFQVAAPTATSTSPTRYTVVVTLRAKNAFGALRLTTARCAVSNITFDGKGGYSYMGAVEFTP